MGDRRARRAEKKAEKKAAKKARQSGASTIEGGEPSTVGGTAQMEENAQQRLERTRRESMQHLTPVHETFLDKLERQIQTQSPKENQRANENLPEQAERLARERTQFLLEAASHTTDEEAFTTEWRTKYREREEIKRGISSFDRYSLDEEKIKERSKIELECDIIIEGEQKYKLEDAILYLTEDAIFNRTVLGLNKVPPERRSPEWKKFRVEKYEPMKEKYKFGEEGRGDQELMLLDILQVERKNRCSLEQIKSKKFKIVIGLVLHECSSLDYGCPVNR
jgi:hypothetical protein